MKRILLLVLVVMLTAVVASAAEKAKLGVFMPAYAAKVTGKDMQGLVNLADKKLLNKRMTPEEMSAFMGSSVYQSKMVFSFYNAKDKLMTPLEFVHFLSEDLFNRKALAMFVKDNEKAELRHRMKFMDTANAGTLLSAAEISALLKGFVLDDISVTTIQNVLNGLQ